MRRQGHALRVGRKRALARWLDCQIVPTIRLHSLTPKTLFRHHRGLAGPRVWTLDRHGRRNVRVGVVGLKGEIVRHIVEKTLAAVFENQAGEWAGFTRQL